MAKVPDPIRHLDEPHPLADLMTVIERVRECTCYNRTCDYCRNHVRRNP